MFKKQGDAVKEWLLAFKNNEEHIDDQINKIRALKSRMRSVGAKELSDMPRPPSNSKDKMAEYVIQLEGLEISLQRDIDIQEECQKIIDELVKQLDKPEERLIITNRYMYGMEWNDVLYRIYSREDKYAQNMESYRRRMYRVHEEALEKMAKKWNKYRNVKK